MRGGHPPAPTSATALATAAAPELVVPASSREERRQAGTAHAEAIAGAGESAVPADDAAELVSAGASEAEARHGQPGVIQKRADLVVYAPAGPRTVIDVAVVHTEHRGSAVRDVQRQEQLKYSMYGAQRSGITQDGSRLIPFVVHARGGMGAAALTFVHEIAAATHQKAMAAPKHLRPGK